MTNVQFIIQYLSEYPGSRYTDITKTLCAWKGKFWTRGTYVRYFSKYRGGGSYNENTHRYVIYGMENNQHYEHILFHTSIAVLRRM